jgi:gamma-glutamyltranspeptidase/glutathione hydrolase
MSGEGQPQTQATILTRRPSSAGLDRRPQWRRPGAVRTHPGDTVGALNPEGRYPAELARDFQAPGHEVNMGEAWNDLCGHAHCIWLAPDWGLSGGSDPRADGGTLEL